MTIQRRMDPFLIIKRASNYLEPLLKTLVCKMDIVNYSPSSTLVNYIKAKYLIKIVFVPRFLGTAHTLSSVQNITNIY